MSFENPETWLLVLARRRCCWPRSPGSPGRCSHRAATPRSTSCACPRSTPRRSPKSSNSRTKLSELAGAGARAVAAVADGDAGRRPRRRRRPRRVSSITPSGARGYEMAIRMARGGATIEEIVASCGTTRSEARLLRRLHCAGGATAA